MACEAFLAGFRSSGAVAEGLRAGFVLLVVAAMAWDVRERRIPNGLVLALLTGGLLFALVTQPGWMGLRGALAGVGVGFAIWIGFYALGVMGAGDVKFYAAASAWLGPGLSWRAALLAGVLGGVLSVAFLLREARLGHTLRRLALLPFTRSLPTPQVVALDLPAGRRQLPYGVALGLGATVAFLFPATICGA